MDREVNVKSFHLYSSKVLQLLNSRHYLCPKVYQQPVLPPYINIHVEINNERKTTKKCNERKCVSGTTEDNENKRKYLADLTRPCDHPFYP